MVNINIEPSILSLMTATMTPAELLVFLIDHPTCDHTLSSALKRVLFELENNKTAPDLNYEVDDLTSTNKYLYSYTDNLERDLEISERQNRRRDGIVASAIDLLKSI